MEHGMSLQAAAAKKQQAKFELAEIGCLEPVRREAEVDEMLFRRENLYIRVLQRYLDNGQMPRMVPRGYTIVDVDCDGHEARRNIY